MTARQWRDIWLHEGFACYAEWLWSEHSGGPSADELARRYHEQLRQKPQDLLLSDPGPRSMFDDRVYKRGALTLHALRGQLGDEKFFALLRDWTTLFRHDSVVTEDFTGLAANYSERATGDRCGMRGSTRHRCREGAQPRQQQADRTQRRRLWRGFLP